MRNPQNDTLGTLTRSARDEGAAGDPKSPVRTCVLTREPGTRDSLIRLALGPDGQVAPDVRARAPGRGAWIGVNRAALDAANAKGKLKAALARAFKTGDLDHPRRSRREDRGRVAPGRARPPRPRSARRHPDQRRRQGRNRVPRRPRQIADPRRGRRASTAASGSTPHGASAAASNGAWFSRPRAPSCRWRWAAKMWYISP